MSNPLVSVYITNYNYELYIQQAIESMLNQSYQNFELFIIDDGSTDNSKSIIESFAGNDKISIIYQKNKGLNITNNIALRLANGKYIMRLDADDYLTSDALEKMVNVLEKDNQLGMVFPDYYLVDAKNEIMAEVKRHDFDQEVGLFDQPAHGAVTMIRTQLLKDVGGYDESYSCQDGYELWIKFISKFKVTNINEFLFYYRQHGNNLTTNENRILDTRRAINNNFVLKNEVDLPNVIGIVPIRPSKLSGEMFAFIKLGNKRLIDIKIEALLEAQHLDKIIITSSDDVIGNYIKSTYKDESKVMFISRTAALERFNVSLRETINNVIEHEKVEAIKPEAFMILPLEYLFLNGSVVDDAIHALKIFNADSLISVRPELSSFYQHHGNGMVPIMEHQESFTQLEREALFKNAGGIQLTLLNTYKKEHKILSGKVGHIVVDKQTAIGVFSKFDLEIAKFLIEKTKQ